MMPNLDRGRHLAAPGHRGHAWQCALALLAGAALVWPLVVGAQAGAAASAPAAAETTAAPTATSTPAPVASAVAAEGRLIAVGARRTVRTIAQAAALAQDGDTIEIDPGDYRADVAVWDRAELTIRARAPGVRLVADGAAAEGKAIFVVRRGRVRIEGLEFTGARVPDRNGAGIRHERGQLTVVRCRFLRNENGILAGNTPDATLRIEASEFGENGAGDGLSHNLYVGKIASLAVTGSWFHHANVGHLLKSRARANLLAYNRLTDEPGGRASYELEFPNGGDTRVIGNLIEQGAQTQNPVIVSYGVEGYDGPVNRLLMVHNTIVNEHPSPAVFLRVSGGAESVRLRGNLLVGPGRVDVAGPMETVADILTDRRVFANAAALDFRPRASVLQPLREAPPAPADEVPQAEYLHPLQVRTLTAPPRYPGALQTAAP